MTKTTISTAHGYKVTAQRNGIEYQLETTNAKGDVIANVTLTESEFVTLVNDMDALVA